MYSHLACIIITKLIFCTNNFKNIMAGSALWQCTTLLHFAEFTFIGQQLKVYKAYWEMNGRWFAWNPFRICRKSFDEFQKIAFADDIVKETWISIQNLSNSTISLEIFHLSTEVVLKGDFKLNDSPVLVQYYTFVTENYFEDISATPNQHICKGSCMFYNSFLTFEYDSFKN